MLALDEVCVPQGVDDELSRVDERNDAPKPIAMRATNAMRRFGFFCLGGTEARGVLAGVGPTVMAGCGACVAAGCLLGEAVAPAAKFYKVPPEHILVVSDEIHLQPGRLRIRTKGSAGGHNGLKSIIACLGTDAFPRIRIGVGAPPHPDYDMPDWVLGTFRGEDKTAMDDAAVRAAEACAVYIRDGADRAMSRFN